MCEFSAIVALRTIDIKEDALRHATKTPLAAICLNLDCDIAHLASIVAIRPRGVAGRVKDQGVML